MAKTQYLAAYDVTDNDLRNLTADLLKNAGMERIQYSVFYGELTRNEAEELAIQFKEQTLDHKAQLILIPICETCSKKQIVTINEGNCPHDNDGEEDDEKPESKETTEAKAQQEQGIDLPPRQNSKTSKPDSVNETNSQPAIPSNPPPQKGSNELCTQEISNTLQNNSALPASTQKHGSKHSGDASLPNPKTKTEIKTSRKTKKTRKSPTIPLDETKVKQRNRVLFF